VYISNDGVNLMLLNTMDIGSQFLDLCSYSPANAKYVAYVEAVGKPSLKNQMSNAVNFSTTCVVSIPPPPPPTLSLGATPTAIEIPSGQTGSASVSVIPVGGAVNSAVALSCSDLPAELQCLFAPTSVTPGANTASSTLSISSSGVARLKSPAIPGKKPYPAGLLFANLGVAGLVFAGGACSKKRIRQLLLIGALSVMAAMLGGCSIGKSSTMQNSPAGPVVPVVPAAKTYTITLNGDGGSQHISTQVTVTVK
jgi:hypothetical protein